MLRNSSHKNADVFRHLILFNMSTSTSLEVNDVTLAAKQLLTPSYSGNKYLYRHTLLTNWYYFLLSQICHSNDPTKSMLRWQHKNVGCEVTCHQKVQNARILVALLASCGFKSKTKYKVCMNSLWYKASAKLVRADFDKIYKNLKTKLFTQEDISNDIKTQPYFFECFSSSITCVYSTRNGLWAISGKLMP